MTSSRDIEKLSSYLDNQLTLSERTRLEKRLIQEPVLKQELESLRRTRLMLRALPRRRAPRNFTLSPQMAGVKQTTLSRPIFGWVSAVAMILLIFVFIGDFLLIPEYVGMFHLPQSRSVEEVAMEPKMLQDQPEAPVEPEALVFPTPLPAPEGTPAPAEVQPAAKSAPVGGGFAPTATADPRFTLEAPVAADAMPEEPQPEMPLMESARAFSEETASPEDSTTLAQESSIVDATQTSSETAVVQMVPTEPPGLAAGSEETTLQAPAAEPQPGRSGLWFQLVLWMTELLLLSLAGVAGLVALYFRLRHSA